MRSRQENRKSSRLALVVFWVLFGVFVLNVLLGKAAITYGWEGLPPLNDFAEFLLLLSAMVVFVVAALRREAALDSAAKGQNSNREE